MKKLTFRNIIIIVLLSIFVFSYVRQRVAIDRIEKQLNEKQLQLDEITKKIVDCQMKWKRLILVQMNILKN